MYKVLSLVVRLTSQSVAGSDDLLHSLATLLLLHLLLKLLSPLVEALHCHYGPSILGLNKQSTIL